MSSFFLCPQLGQSLLLCLFLLLGFQLPPLLKSSLPLLLSLQLTRLDESPLPIHLLPQCLCLCLRLSLPLLLLLFLLQVLQVSQCRLCELFHPLLLQLTNSLLCEIFQPLLHRCFLPGSFIFLPPSSLHSIKVGRPSTWGIVLKSRSHLASAKERKPQGWG